ncbi:MAG TPA: EamA family transporter, partial [Beijerinckiaceae bacterium]
GVGRAVAAGLVSYAAATAAVAVFLLSPRSLRDVTAVRRADAWWFTLAGLFVGVAQMLRYMALALAPVSIVSPMMRLASVFRVYFSWLINREHEEFGRGVLLATVVSLVGAVILSLQAEAVVAWLDPSPAVAAFLRLRWP